MPRRTSKGNSSRKLRRKRKRRFRITGLFPSARTRRRWLRAFRRAPALAQILVGVAALAVLWLALNWTYQVARKPSELFFPVSGVLYKTPTQTWRTYGALFRKHSTAAITPEFLAALAQIEGSGNPIVRTYWRWSLTRKPLDVYRPASSSVGMYQITDGTFAEARRYCIHRHTVVEDGAWHALRSCWFNGLYTRVVPSHAIELTSAYLDRRVAQILERHSAAGATSAQKQKLAAIIHLCGAGAGNAYARRRFQIAAGERCGDHDVAAYLAKIDGMRAVFERLS
jgi:hypothetical protein